MWSKKSAELKFLDPEIFIARSRNEERTCGFVLALAAYFNDSKSLMGMYVRLLQEKPTFKRVCAEMGEFSALKNYLDRLLYSHYHELHYMLQQRLSGAAAENLYQSTVKNMRPKHRQRWMEIVRMSTDPSDEHKKWLKKFRDGLGFHYVRHPELYEAFQQWKADIQPGGPVDYQEGAYISIGGSIEATRYFFADAAVNYWMNKELAAFPKGPPSGDLVERNALGISGFLHAFFALRGGVSKKSVLPLLPSAAKKAGGE